MLVFNYALFPLSKHKQHLFISVAARSGWYGGVFHLLDSFISSVDDEKLLFITLQENWRTR